MPLVGRPVAALDGLAAALASAAPVTLLMKQAGHNFYLVGGVVRDALMGSPFLAGSSDLDCTTDASPDAVLRIVSPAATAVWSQGRRFGTIGCVVDGQVFEITTHRADSYDPTSRKPVVAFGLNVIDDLYRRDFTVNAIAVDATDGHLVDPCGGRNDLVAGLLRTPLDPAVSFGEDPLRMLRAARFIAAYRLEPSQQLAEAVTAMGDRLEIVSTERIRDELEKLLLVDNPEAGLCFMGRTGLLGRVLPERVPGCAVGCAVAAVDPEPALRWAALLAGIPKPVAVARLRCLRVRATLIKAVGHLLDAAKMLEAASSDAPSVRRLVHECPAELDKAVAFVKAIMSTRGDSVETLNDFLVALADLRQHEDLTRLDPPLTGTQVMHVLDIEPGPKVGQALAFLRELAFRRGPLSHQAATRALCLWYSATR